MTGVPLARGNSEGKGDPSEGTSKGGRRTEGGCATYLGVPLAFRGKPCAPYTHCRAGAASLVVDESWAGFSLVGGAMFHVEHAIRVGP